jgi:hypothetical protein
VRLSVPSNIVRWSDAFSTGVREGNVDHPKLSYITEIHLSMFNFVDTAFAIILGITVAGAIWFLISQEDN